MQLSNWLILPILVSWVSAVDIEFSDTDSVNSGLKLIAKGLMDYYNGNDSGQVPGMFANPYYWWEAGAAWNSMLDYWFYTGDTTYNDIVKTSLLFQIGNDWDYMPSNQTTTEGNDDQGFWGITVMAAAEKNFENPSDEYPSWAYLAQAVFNTMADRWDTGNCNGGLRWQIFTWNNGYDYKNTVSNGCLFNLATRLARYTGNSTYVEWAEKVWDWTESVGFIVRNENYWPVYDGGFIQNNCTDTDPIEWTYNSGLFLSGSAVMYNYTGESKWLERATGIWGRAKVFFLSGKIMYEAACQPSNQCNNDQRCFKGIFSRFLSLTAVMAPTLSTEIMEYLQSSAEAAAKSCSGGTDGHTCGLNWGSDGWDGLYGLGEQMSALEVIQNLRVFEKTAPLTESTGASSKSNGSAGTSRSDKVVSQQLHISTKDRAGAGIITAIVIILLLLVTWWVVV